MKNLDIELLLKDYKSIEKEAHVWLDDVINKVTQEIWELIEAHSEWDIPEMYNEAWDVLANIYSTCEELCLNLDYNLSNDWENTISPVDLVILHWKWNSKIQWLRSRYSREDVSIWDVQCITNELIKEVLNYSNPDLDIWQVISKNIEKFNTRRNDS